MTTPNAADANNAAPAAAAAPAAPAAPTKMDQSKVLYEGLLNKSIAVIEGKSARATFIRRAQDDFGLTASGAATYWQNLESLRKGGKLYPHTGKAGKKTENAPEAGDKPAEPAADAEPEAKDDVENSAEDAQNDDVSHLA